MLRGAVVFILIVSLSCALWWSARMNAERQIKVSAELTADYASSQVALWLSDRAGVSAHLATLIGTQDTFDEADFRSNARRIAGVVSGFQAINWIDTDGVIRIVVPANGNEAALGYELLRHPRDDIRSALAKAMKQGKTSRTLGTVQLLQGGQGFAVYTPAYDSHHELQGVVNSVFRLDALKDACLSEIATEQFAVTLAEDDGTVVIGDSLDPTRPPPFMSERTVNVVDRPWHIYIAPTLRLRKQYFSAASPAILVAGLVGGGALAWIQLLLARREEELEESRKRFIDLFENSSVPMINWQQPQDADHIDIAEANRAAAQLTGYTTDQLRGRLSRLFDAHPLDWDRVKALVTNLPKNETPVSIGRVNLVRRDGQSRLIEMTVKLANIGHDTSEVRATMVDVTEQVRIEAQLRQNQKMDAIGKLAGGIAHDFNNLIQSISMAADLLRDYLSREPEQAKLVDEIHFATDRAAGLVNQLLTFGRKSEVNLELLDFNAVINQSTSFLSRLIGENIELVTDLAQDVPGVRADRSQLDQILVNLCVNARDAMPGGGRIEISTRTVHFDEQDLADKPWAHTGSFVCLCVHDEGHGIDPALIDKIFEPFFSTKPMDQGSGLGLANVYGIVHNHGGMVNVTSVPGDGAVFEIYIPVAEEVGATTVPSSTERTDATSRAASVLVVEDDESVRGFTVRVLEHSGYVTHVAEDGLAALDLLEGGLMPDVIVSDVVMPKMGGFEMYHEIGKRGMQLRFIFTSGYSVDDVPLSIREDPHVRLLPKPYRREELLAAIPQLLTVPITAP
ncbi:MAG: response regulator [Pseudomonadales bacterium]|nr:response regulator [Pseudomonadales bacterium]